VRSYEATKRGFTDGVHKYASESLVLIIQEMLVSSFVQGGQVFLRWRKLREGCGIADSMAVSTYQLLAQATFHFPTALDGVYPNTFVLEFFYHDMTLKVRQYDWMH
jgi:alpha-D-ribose 1-methylphosphonate 5-triphosphate synthase subunit PhnH